MKSGRNKMTVNTVTLRASVEFERALRNMHTNNMKKIIKINKESKW